jgi:hypothetical protein
VYRISSVSPSKSTYLEDHIYAKWHRGFARLGWPFLLLSHSNQMAPGSLTRSPQKHHHRGEAFCLLVSPIVPDLRHELETPQNRTNGAEHIGRHGHLPDIRHSWLGKGAQRLASHKDGKVVCYAARITFREYQDTDFRTVRDARD